MIKLCSHICVRFIVRFIVMKNYLMDGGNWLYISNGNFLCAKNFPLAKLLVLHFPKTSLSNGWVKHIFEHI